MTFNENQLNTNYVIKLNKRTHDFVRNYDEAPLTYEQESSIIAHYLANSDLIRSCGGWKRPLCSKYVISSKVVGLHMYMFKITKATRKLRK